MYQIKIGNLNDEFYSRVVRVDVVVESGSIIVVIVEFYFDSGVDCSCY